MPRTRFSRNKSKYEKELEKKYRPVLRRGKGANTLYGPVDLAKQIGKSRNYVYIMRRAGFPMTDGLATYNDAVRWLFKNRRWFRTDQEFVKHLPTLKEIREIERGQVCEGD